MKFPLGWTYRFLASPNEFLDWCRNELPHGVGTGAGMPVSVETDDRSVVLHWGSGAKEVVFRCTVEPAGATSSETEVSVRVDMPKKGVVGAIFGQSSAQLLAVGDFTRFPGMAEEAGFKLLSPVPPFDARGDL